MNDTLRTANAAAIAEGDDPLVTHAGLADLPREDGVRINAWIARLYWLYARPLQDALGEGWAVGVEPQLGGGCHGLGIDMPCGGYAIMGGYGSMPATYGDDDLYTGSWGCEMTVVQNDDGTYRPATDDDGDDYGWGSRGLSMDEGHEDVTRTQAEWIAAAVAMLKRLDAGEGEVY